MKKNYLFTLALFLGLTTYAQNNIIKGFEKAQLQPMEGNGTLIKPIKLVKNDKAPGDIIWSEDFTGGLPTGWYVQDNTGNNYNWVIQPAGILPNTPFTQNQATIASTSGGNSMLLYSELYNNPVSATSPDIDSYFQTTGIQVNNALGLSVNFQQSFRRCCGNIPTPLTVLSVSTDSTFTTNFQEYDMIGGVATNDPSADPMNVSINISAIAANYTGKIWLRFHIQSGTAAYYWMIDDIAIVESPTNDLVTEAGYYGFTPVGTFGIQYTRIPVTHIQPADFTMIVDNIGTAAQTGTNLTVNISDGTSPVFNQSTADITLPSLVRDTLEMFGQWTPPTTIGIPYTVSLNIFSDSTDVTPANNTMTLPPFQVSNYILALDDYSTTPGNGGAQSDPFGATEHEIGNFFESSINDIATGIEFLAGSNSTLGVTIDAFLYRGSVGSFVLVGRSSFHTLVASDILTPRTLLLIDPNTGIAPVLNADSTYFMGIHSFDDQFQIATSGSAPLPGTNSASHSNVFFPDAATAATIFSLPATPMIRLSVEPTTSIAWSNQPNNITIACDASSLPINTGSATATTTCASGLVSVTYSDFSTSGACANASIITRTWTATDNCGNSENFNQIITLQDIVSPTITCPGNQTQTSSNGTSTTLSIYTAMATISDNCSSNANITVTQSPAIGSIQNVGTINVTLTATDECGNSSSCNFDVVITTSTTAITWTTQPTNTSIACDASSLPANTGSAIATTTCISGGLSISYSDAIVLGACANASTITRTWTATNNCGNSETFNQTITIQDNTSPVITCPSNQSQIALGVNTTLNDYTTMAIVSDNCSSNPNISITQSPAIGSIQAIGTLNVTLTATDECGNTSNCNFDVTISSAASAITWTNQPTTIIIECDVSNLPINTGNATATTTCSSGGLSTNFSDAIVSGSCTNSSIITRTWTATDNCGNNETYDQIIITEDNTPPLITCPVNQVQNASNGIDTTLLDYTTMTIINDNCSNNTNITVTQLPAIGSTQTVGTLNVTLTATDECGNTSNCNFDVNIQSTLGITDNTRVNNAVFPNPNNGLFTIDLGTEMNEEVIIRIYNVLGETVYNEINNSKQIDLQHVKKGIYYLSIEGEKKPIVKKIIIL